MSEAMRTRIFEALGHSGNAFIIAALHPQDPQTNDIIIRLDRQEQMLAQILQWIKSR